MTHKLEDLLAALRIARDAVALAEHLGKGIMGISGPLTAAYTEILRARDWAQPKRKERRK